MAIRRPVAPTVRPEDTLRVNRRIDAPRVRLVDPENKTNEIMPLRVALERAATAGLDLVEISPESDPPVCKILNYSRFRYQEGLERVKNQKMSKAVPLKEIQLRPGIADNDYQVKLKNAIRFLEGQHKVKVSLQFRGREIMVQQEMGHQLLRRLVQDVEPYAKLDSTPTSEGKRVIMILVPNKPAIPKGPAGVNTPAESTFESQ